jgi:hypothetical protein
MSTTRIGIVLVISLAFFAAEITGLSFSSMSLNWLEVITNSVGFKTSSLALIADAVRYSFTAFITATDPCDCRAKFHYFNVG